MLSFALMSTKPIPDEYDVLIPSIIVRDAAKAIEFYKTHTSDVTQEQLAKGAADWGKEQHA